MIAMCGNGALDEGEACDNGAVNGTEAGDCAPDCSKVVEERRIWLSPPPNNDPAEGNPIETADAACMASGNGTPARAMMAFTNVRRAPSLDGMVTAIDWPLTPWTRYARDGALVWITDRQPLLGARDGQMEELLAPIGTAVDIYVRTGLTDQWTALPFDCDGWTSTDSSSKVSCGSPTEVSSAFLYLQNFCTCDFAMAYYCVEVEP
jgi:hypothetical protein